jgi:SAM-dependent methyltransferase
MTLHFNKDRYTGDVIAAASEPLPFSDDAFQLVLIQHVLEVTSAPLAVLDDALRMLAPGGVMVITGLHPISAWSPWFWWRGRHTVQRLHFPLGLNGTLLDAGMEVERLTRVGRSWPARPSTVAVPDNIFGGGYVLVARKRRQTMTRLHLSRIGTPLSSRGPLSAETRRRAAQ